MEHSNDVDLKSSEHFKEKVADAKFWFAFVHLADTFTQSDIIVLEQLKIRIFFNLKL